MSMLKNLFSSAAENTDTANAENVKRLFAAVQNDDLPLMKSLLDAGVPVDARNDFEETPLMLAVQRHHLTLVNELLDRKADPNAVSWDNLTPLSSAAQMGHWDVVEQLALHRAQISSKNAKEFLTLNALLLRGIEENDSAPVSALKAAGVNDAETLRNKVFQIVEKNDAAGLERCLVSGVPENLRDAQGNTLLIKAVEAGAQDAFDVLTGFGADASAKNNAGETALFLAQKKRDNAMIAALLGNDAKADPATMSKDELQQALTAAVAGGRTQTVVSLLGVGADPSGLTDEGVPLLFLAANKKYHEITAHLVNAGADLFKPGTAGVFKVAASLVKSRDVKAVTRMLDSNALALNTGPEAFDQYSLLHVAAESDVDVARLLIQRDPLLVHRKEKWGSTPLRVALETKNAAMVELLLEAGSDPRTQGKSPDSDQMNDKEYAEIHFDNPEIIEAFANAEKKFELMEDAVRRNDVAVFEEALRGGVSPNMIDYAGNTPLFYAIQNGNISVFKALLQQGANPCQETLLSKRAPIAVAVSCGQAEMVRMLGDAGGSVMTPDSEGITPLSLSETLGGRSATPEMKEALEYCRNLDINRMSQQAIRLENKTTVFKPLRFKIQAQPQVMA